jgi:hypothetical protein
MWSPKNITRVTNRWFLLSAYEYSIEHFKNPVNHINNIIYDYILLLFSFEVDRISVWNQLIIKFDNR